MRLLASIPLQLIFNKSCINRFESCRQLSADQKDAPGFAGAFLFAADTRACSQRMRKAKMGVSVANGHRFGLKCISQYLT